MLDADKAIVYGSPLPVGGTMVGVYIDDNMNMDKHVNTVVSHCYKILKDIGRIKRFLSRQRLEQLIHAIIAPIGLL